MPRSRIPRPHRKQRAIYLTDNDYAAFFKESIADDQTFSDWAKQAMKERMQRNERAVRPVDRQVPDWVSPLGTLWPKDKPCWCEQCHDPWKNHIHQATAAEAKDAGKFTTKKHCDV